VAGTGTEQTAFHSGNQQVLSSCDADCGAFSPDRIELLTRDVILVAGINLADADQAAVFARVVVDLTIQRAAAGAAPPMDDSLFTSYFLNEVLRNRRIEAEAV
jgi:hypothetical protein